MTELIRLIIKAVDIKKERIISSNQIKVANPTRIHNTNPFKIETASSLLNSQFKFDALICSSVKPLKTIVRVCVAATPPMLATIGIRIAR